MTSERDTSRIVASWLEAGSTGLPERVLEAVLSELPSTPQRRHAWSSWRLPMQLTLTRTPFQRPLLVLASVVLLLLAFLATAMVIGSPRPDAPLPFRNGAVVYDANGALYIADELGGTPRKLVGDLGDRAVTAFSPQGDRVAYVSATPNMAGANVMTVRTDGSDVTALARLPGWYGTQVDWAPDGRALVASTNGISEGGAFGTGPSTWQLAVIAADGSGLRMVDAGPRTSAGRAAWRPDGRLIAFVGYTKPPVRDVFIADGDGSNVRKIAGAVDVASDGVAWSPDGTRLSVLRYREDRTIEIAIVTLDADGRVTGSTSIRPDPAIPARLPPPPVEAEGTPRWSPDGSQLAYAQLDGEVVRIGISAPDGSGFRTFAVESSADASSIDLQWSPDGRSLVIEGFEPGPQRMNDPKRPMSWLIDPATGEATPADVHIGDWRPLAP